MSTTSSTKVLALAEELLANKEWRDDQNIRAGLPRKLTVKELYEIAKEQAAHFLEENARLDRENTA